ncbi:phage antirepressor N-terminal domain-containing protein [Flavobacterium taihuense]|jgi:hypothetical protein|uniref:Phage antirepressor N-terminal domain-containing protein n=1 Tax=Flavobacterium taihuense TaxID=2857508 RepID=A0ABS6Y0P4_9FLAO|nr:phage antirepressor N-terminal domain-containing protein [Flavobacterium taihuense]MBW4362498.1 phage antirepressor N-terminal domain-containing protein [Flavobacterium taihuense]
MNTPSIIINGNEIFISNNGSEKAIAIKQICNALGVDFSRQLKKIKEDEILGSVMGVTPTTGADGKTYEMNTLPLKYIFGWLFTINPENVNPEIKQDLIKYRKQCYEKLFDSFTKRDSILKEKAMYQIEIERLENELKSDDRYKKIQELKTSVKMASQQFNSLNKSVVNEQLDLFKNNDIKE